MAILGKRKASEPSVEGEDASEIFRRHFEAQFAPIETPQKKRALTGTNDSAEEGSGEEDGSEESEWGGLSNDEISGDDDEAVDEAPVVEVVDHSTSQTSKPVAMSKRDLKAFMVRRPSSIQPPLY